MYLRVRKRILSILLVGTLTLSTLPTQLFATDTILSQITIQKVDNLNTKITTSAGAEVNQQAIVFL